MRKESSSSVRIFYPKFNKEELIQKLKERIEELAGKLPLSLVVLFGSYARGNYTVASDVDLLIVYSGKERKNAFTTAKKTLDMGTGAISFNFSARSIEGFVALWAKVW